MTYLEAINTILRYLGEYPIESAETLYPTVELIKPALEEQRISLLVQGWWFNTHKNRTLEPDAIGQVVVPECVLLCVPVNPQYIWDGTRIVTQDGMAPDSPVQADLVMDMCFEDLPVMAQKAVVYAAAYATYIGDFGEDNTSQALRQQAASYYQVLTSQHVRTRKYSTKDRDVYRRYLSALRQ